MSLLPVGIGSAEAGGYQIERSLRFNSADSAYLNRTFGTPTDNKRWTLSFWIKRTKLGRENIFGYNGATNEGSIDFDAGNTLYINPRVGTVGGAGTNYFLQTTQVFRDVSAWYHIIYALDTTQATASNRVKLYVNGTQVTTFSTTNYPPQNSTPIMGSAVSHAIGRIGESGYEYYFNGYLTEINFIDGQALTPSSFGETDTDTGVWKPKAYSGSYGTNGFYLNFSDNSGTTSTTLGKDRAGSNNWTPNNFSVTAGAGNDSLVDTPTNYGTDTGAGGEVRGSYCTINPLDNAQGATLSNGNLQAVNVGNDKFYRATFGMPSGKWYWEVLFSNLQNRNRLGVTDNTLNASGTTLTGDYALVSTGNQSYNTSTASTPTVPSFATNDIICFAFDADAGILYFEKNATPNTSTSPKFTGLSTSKTYFVTCQEPGTASTNVFNFGARAFSYTAPSGFKALCTQNLPEPTIVDGKDYFNVVTYTGTLTDGQGTGATQSITGVGFQPDFLWLKNRTNANQHLLVDAVRTVTNYRYLNSASTDAESTVNSNGAISALNADGFTVQNGNDTSAKANLVGRDGWNYVAWNWKANGAGSTNTAGSITSTVSVNTTSGFSIVTFTSDGATAGGTAGHGLGVAPSMVIYKGRNTVENWYVYHASLGGSNTLFLNATNASTGTSIFNSTTPTSSVIQLRQVSWGASNLVAYCFAPVAGYSAFGSYTGNGSATDGVFVYLGFRPKFVLIKSSSNTSNWIIFDSARGTYNVNGPYLYANGSDAEGTSTTVGLDFLSNGFKNRNDYGDANTSARTYIYMAFAENPFKYSLAR